MVPLKWMLKLPVTSSESAFCPRGDKNLIYSLTSLRRRRNGSGPWLIQTRVVQLRVIELPWLGTSGLLENPRSTWALQEGELGALGLCLLSSATSLSCVLTGNKKLANSNEYSCFLSRTNDNWGVQGTEEQWLKGCPSCTELSLTCSIKLTGLAVKSTVIAQGLPPAWQMHLSVTACVRLGLGFPLNLGFWWSPLSLWDCSLPAVRVCAVLSPGFCPPWFFANSCPDSACLLGKAQVCLFSFAFYPRELLKMEVYYRAKLY